MKEKQCFPENNFVRDNSHNSIQSIDVFFLKALIIAMQQIKDKLMNICT